ncbi:unnamed protein product, partial [Prorocentrum cordatum]
MPWMRAVAQRAPAGIYDELWELDEGRCSVSGRVRLRGLKEGAAGTKAASLVSLEWEDPAAAVLTDEQGEAPADGDAAPRPLFSYVAPQILAQ